MQPRPSREIGGRAHQRFAMPRPSALLPALVLAMLAAPAAALSIDFEEFSDGEIVAAPVGTHPGYTLTANSFRGPEIAVVHDTTPGDDESPFPFEPDSFLPPRHHEEIGNVLVLSDVCVSPPCRPHRGGAGGQFRFSLEDATSALSFDWINFGRTPGSGRIRLFLSESGFVDFALSAPGTSGAVTHFDLGEIGEFRAFEFVFYGSIGVDNIRSGGFQPVPEPASASLLGVALAVLAIARRRRSG